MERLVQVVEIAFLVLIILVIAVALIESICKEGFAVLYPLLAVCVIFWLGAIISIAWTGHSHKKGSK